MKAKELYPLAIIKLVIGVGTIPVEIWISNKIAEATNHAINGNPEGVLTITAFVMIVLTVLVLIKVTSDIVVDRNTLLASQKIKIRIYNKLFSRPMYDLFSSSEGKLEENLNDDYKKLINHTIRTLPTLSTGLISMVIYLLYVIFMIQPIVAVLLLLIGVVQAVPPVITKKLLQKNYEDTRIIEAELTEFNTETHMGLSIIKLFQLEGWHATKLREINKRYFKIGTGGITANTTEKSLNIFINLLLRIGTYILLGMLVLYKIISLEDAVKASILSQPLYNSMQGIFSTITVLGVENTAANHFRNWNQKSNEVPDSIALAMTDITFGFGQNKIIRNMTVKFPTKGICLVKGDNGSGKSTLLHILLGLINPLSGTVTVGNTKIEDIANTIFPSQIFFLPQVEPAYHITAEEMVKMLKEASAGELPLSFSKMYTLAHKFGLAEPQLSQTQLCDLSGGESKKIYLSLAFALDPHILILDEPTNNLDESSKQVLLSLIKDSNRLIILTCHENLFDEISDYILQLKDGKVSYVQQKFN